MNRTSIFATLFLVALITTLVGSRLKMSVNPGFMFQEQYGLGYNFAPHLGSLCDPNPLKGLEGPTSNVTDQRSLSLLYVVPTKLLRHTIDPYVLHRALGIIFFGLTLIGLWGLARTLGFSVLPTVLLIVTVGLSTQLISYLYESKLTITSAAWFTLTLWAIAALDESLQAKNISKTSALLFILPLLIASSYETYTVSRPLAIVALLFLGGYRLWCADTRGYKLRFSAIFFGSIIMSGIILKLLHPSIRFDQTLFEGRTESLVTPRGDLFHGWRETIGTRISEIPAIFKWSPNYFSSETLNESGSLELWLALAICAFVSLSALSGSSACRARATINQRSRFYLILFILCGAAVVIPLFSITHIRGHRLFGLYISGAVFLAGLVQSLLQHDHARLRCGVTTVALLFIGAISFFRIPLVMRWTPQDHFTPPYAHQTIAALKTLDLPNGLSPLPNSVLVRICDQVDPPSWEHFWNAALYVSDYGCKVGGATTRLGCNCESLENTEGLRGIVCLTRTIAGPQPQLTTRFIPVSKN